MERLDRERIESDGGEEDIFHDIDIFLSAATTQKSALLPDHLQKISQVLQTMNSIVDNYSPNFPRSVEISRAREDVVKASGVLIFAIERLTRLSQNGSLPEDKNKHVHVISSQNTPPFVRASAVNMEDKFNPPQSTTAAKTSSTILVRNTTSSSSSSAPFSLFSASFKPTKLVAVSKASTASQASASSSSQPLLYSTGQIKFDRISTIVSTPGTKPNLQEEEVGVGRIVSKHSEETQTNKTDSSNHAFGDSKVEEKDSSDEDTIGGDHEDIQGGGSMFLPSEDTYPQDDADFTQDAMETRTSRRASRRSQDFSWLNPGLPFYVHSEEIDGTVYRFTMSDGYCGRVTSRPTMTRPARGSFEVCFCSHRNLQHQADYVYCIDGRVCNHFVHKYCVERKAYSNKAPRSYVESTEHDYVCHHCAAAPYRAAGDGVALISQENSASKRKQHDAIDAEPAGQKKVKTQPAAGPKCMQTMSYIKRQASAKQRQEQASSQPAVKSEEAESVVMKYVRNQSLQAGKGGHLLTVFANNKPSYVYLNNGFYGFPVITQNALSRVAKAHVNFDVCFCSPKPGSSRFEHMCFVFCARGTKCHHLVHKNCLGIVSQLREAAYPKVFTFDFVCDACSV